MRAPLIPNCTRCHHNFHGLPCQVCPCVTAFIEPEENPVSEMAPERPVPPLCLVCSSPLPEQFGPGRRRKVCRDEDSPTPGGCARWRNIERTHAKHPDRPGTHKHSRPSPYLYFPQGGFTIE